MIYSVTVSGHASCGCYLRWWQENNYFFPVGPAGRWEGHLYPVQSRHSTWHPSCCCWNLKRIYPRDSPVHEEELVHSGGSQLGLSAGESIWNLVSDLSPVNGRIRTCATYVQARDFASGDALAPPWLLTPVTRDQPQSFVTAEPVSMVARSASAEMEME